MNIKIIPLIKENKIPNICLLYGSEDYLKRQYKKRLIEALLPNKDSMNLNFFEKKSDRAGDLKSLELEIISIADTLPFFSDKRVIVCENTGFFKNKTEYIGEYLKNVPEHTYFIFLENEVSFAVKSTKAAVAQGFIEEYNKPDTKDLRSWITGKVKSQGKTITSGALTDFINRTDISMDNMAMELIKLLSYCMDKNNITEEDVREICVTSLEEEVFEIANALSEKNKERALRAYNELYALKIEPRAILGRLNSTFLSMLNISMGYKGKMTIKEMASIFKMKEQAIEIRLRASNRFSIESLKNIIRESQDLLQKMNTGLINDRTGVEMFLLNCLKN